MQDLHSLEDQADQDDRQQNPHYYLDRFTRLDQLGSCISICKDFFKNLLCITWTIIDFLQDLYSLEDQANEDNRQQNPRFILQEDWPERI